MEYEQINSIMIDMNKTFCIEKKLNEIKIRIKQLKLFLNSKLLFITDLFEVVGLLGSTINSLIYINISENHRFDTWKVKDSTNCFILFMLIHLLIFPVFSPQKYCTSIYNANNIVIGWKIKSEKIKAIDIIRRIGYICK